MVTKVVYFSAIVAIMSTACHANPLNAVDVYGTNRFTVEDVKSLAGEDLRNLAEHYSDETRHLYDSLMESILKKLDSLGDFAFLHVSVLPRYNEPNPLDITIDVVELEDAGRRMPFYDEPAGEPHDPEGLCEAWLEYEQIGKELFFSGKARSMKTIALHSLWGFGARETEAFGKRFDEAVPRLERELGDVLHNSSDAAYRKAAAYLLAHCGDADRLAAAITPAILDPNGLVRNAVMRVLGQAARNNRSMDIPLDLMVGALDFPRATDRNKALTTIRFMVDAPEDKAFLLENGGDTLLALLKLNQFANRGPAHNLLKQVIGKSFPDNDLASWESEVTRLRKQFPWRRPCDMGSGYR